MLPSALRRRAATLGKVVSLGHPWRGTGPFLYANYHVDDYPVANKHMGPDPALLKGRNIGWDMANESGTGWNMYMATGPVPGFPAHPHRGFETISIITKGFVDHADSTGAGARYGPGDVQWVTAGSGVRHSEMIPLLSDDKPNDWIMYQLWLNLPKRNKFAPPQFCMFWNETVPQVVLDDGRVTVRVIAGAFGGVQPRPPPRASWASEPGSDLAIWLIDLKAGGRVTLPPPKSPDAKRTLYVHGAGARVTVGGDTPGIPAATVEENSGFEAAQGTGPAHAILITGDTDSTILVLQAVEIGEPVVVKGPWVMNEEHEIAEAYADYKATKFGWRDVWDTEAPVYPRDQGRFANYGDGKKVYPPGAEAK